MRRLRTATYTTLEVAVIGRHIPLALLDGGQDGRGGPARHGRRSRSRPAVIGDVSGNNQADRGNVQNGRVVGIGMADFDGDQFVAFKLEAGTLQWFGAGDA